MAFSTFEKSTKLKSVIDRSEKRAMRYLLSGNQNKVE